MIDHEMPKERKITTSVLIIGLGGAGLRTGIELMENGVDCMAVGKRSREDAHTTLAAGGINAALANVDPEDSWQQHAADTIKESYFLADPHTVEVVTKNAPQGIDDLDRYGMPFARTEEGKIDQRFFGAHKWRRTCFAGDYTGLEIQRTLLRRATELGLPMMDTVYITSLLKNEDEKIFGAYGFDIETGQRLLFYADVVVLAAGGHNRCWRRTSSRRNENTGDTFRLAAEVGCRLRDLELVQFHPSGILEPENVAGTLVSEAARGEGGILRNSLGERYMDKYDPERMELSTRDRVALASYTEIKEGRGTEKGGVYLDVSHLPHEQIMERLPRIYQTLMELQTKDITKEPMEIAPTAHYSMGGVWVSPDDHSTDVEGLFAIGEASSGLHGANRLGGNSLIELLVFGRLTGQAAIKYSDEQETIKRSKAAVEKARKEIDRVLDLKGDESIRGLQRELRNIMTDYCGVVRDEEGLDKALEMLEDVESRVDKVGVYPDRAGYFDLAHAFDLLSSIVAARATLMCAKERRETRGAHNRADYPEQLEEMKVNFCWTIDGKVTKEPIADIPEEIASLIVENNLEDSSKLVE